LVDFAGAGTVFLVGGAVALAGLLALVPRKPRRPAHERDLPVPLPPSHMPLLAAAGALFILSGAVSWAWASPLLILDTVWPMRGAVAVMLAAAGGTLVPMAYTWFVAGRSDPMMAAKGLAAGAIAGMALGPFVRPGAALAIGALVGLLVPLATYLVNEVLRVADDTHVTSIYLLGAAVGIVAVGILADGLAGGGWNQVGAESYLGVTGQGVTGLMAAEGLQRDWPGQVQAQLVGLAALFLVPFFTASLLFVPVAVVMRGLQRPPEEAAAASPAIVVPASLVTGHAVEVSSRPEIQQVDSLEAMEAERP
jgi:Amt family ammonium transporter